MLMEALQTPNSSDLIFTDIKISESNLQPVKPN